MYLHKEKGKVVKIKEHFIALNKVLILVTSNDASTKIDQRSNWYSLCADIKVYSYNHCNAHGNCNPAGNVGIMICNIRKRVIILLFLFQSFGFLLVKRVQQILEMFNISSASHYVHTITWCYLCKIMKNIKVREKLYLVNSMLVQVKRAVQENT